MLVVADDGVGGAHAEVGAGVQGMQERAHMVGGQLLLRRGERGGTEVVLEVPLAGRPG